MDDDGATYLFFQGNNDGGRTWYLSKMKLVWDGNLPQLIRGWDGRRFLLQPFGEVRDTDSSHTYVQIVGFGFRPTD